MTAPYFNTVRAKNQGQTVQTGERPPTNGRTHTHGRYQTYYRPCYASITTIKHGTDSKKYEFATLYKV